MICRTSTAYYTALFTILLVPFLFLLGQGSSTVRATSFAQAHSTTHSIETSLEKKKKKQKPHLTIDPNRVIETIQVIAGNETNVVSFSVHGYKLIPNAHLDIDSNIPDNCDSNTLPSRDSELSDPIVGISKNISFVVTATNCIANKWYWVSAQEEDSTGKSLGREDIAQFYLTLGD